MTKLIEIMKKEYIKPEIEIIHASTTPLMGISKYGLNTADDTLHHSDRQTDETGPGIGGDDDSGDGDLDAAKRWNDWGDIAYKGYDPWK